MTRTSWPHLLFSFTGRISRARWWIGVVVVSVVGGVNAWINSTVAPDDGVLTIGPGLIQIATFVIGIALLWPALAVSVKRWHDRDKSGWWMLIGLIPLIGQIWAIVELGFLAGTDGPNAYGPSPRGDTTAPTAGSGGWDEGT